MRRRPARESAWTWEELVRDDKRARDGFVKALERVGVEPTHGVAILEALEDFLEVRLRHQPPGEFLPDPHPAKVATA